MEINIDYDEIYDNRVAIITGVSRSGTTILGKLIGSLKDVVYCYEPSPMILIPPLIKNGIINMNIGGDLLKSILFEDYLLQTMSGRNINYNTNESSYIGHYININKIKKTMIKSNKRDDIIRDLGDKKFIIKIPNIQPSLDIIKSIFNNVKIINITRNGNDVIESSKIKNFFTDVYISNKMIDISKNNVPWYINDSNLFNKFNTETKIAHIWRVLNEYWLPHISNDNMYHIRLEDLKCNPHTYVDYISEFIGNELTDITNKHIESIINWKDKSYSHNFIIDDIEKPKYVSMMKTFGYEV